MSQTHRHRGGEEKEWKTHRRDTVDAANSDDNNDAKNQNSDTDDGADERTDHYHTSDTDDHVENDKSSMRLSNGGSKRPAKEGPKRPSKEGQRRRAHASDDDDDDIQSGQSDSDDGHNRSCSDDDTRGHKKRYTHNAHASDDGDDNEGGQSGDDLHKRSDSDDDDNGGHKKRSIRDLHHAAGSNINDDNDLDSKETKQGKGSAHSSSIHVPYVPAIFRSAFNPSNIVVVKEYGGCSMERNGGHSTSVKFETSGFSKYFSRYDYPSADERRHAAAKWRAKKSDELELTKTITTIRDIPLNLRQYLAAFADGDGTVGFTAPQVGGRLRVSVSQSSCDDNIPASLSLFYRCFGGSMQGPKIRIRKGRNLCKPEWAWKIYGLKCERILTIIAEHGIVKAPQARLGLEVIALSRKLATPTSLRSSRLLRIPKPEAAKYAKLFKQAKRSYQKVPIDALKITTPYICGVFDAEGSILFRGGRGFGPVITIYFTQHGCVALLEEIKTALNMNANVSRGQLHIAKRSDSIKLLTLMRPYLIEKKSQCELMLKYNDTTPGVGQGRKRYRSHIRYDMKIEKQCKALKRYHASSPASGRTDGSDTTSDTD